jgi:hypothetical protein
MNFLIILSEIAFVYFVEVNEFFSKICLKRVRVVSVL